MLNLNIIWTFLNFYMMAWLEWVNNFNMANIKGVFDSESFS